MKAILIVVIIISPLVYFAIWGLAYRSFVRFQNELRLFCGSRRDFVFLNDRIGGINKRHGLLLMWEPSVILVIENVSHLMDLRKRAVSAFCWAMACPLAMFLFIVVWFLSLALIDPA